MKRKISIALLALLLIASAFTLFSCSKKSDVPSGMQLVAGGTADGYYFYAPEEWTVSNLKDIKSAYASRVDTTSVSFCEIDLSSFISVGVDPSEYFFTSYFNDGLSEFPESAKLEVIKEGEATVFGKEKEDADKALKYTYTCEYSQNDKAHKFGFMQILIEEKNRFYVFTYCALLEVRTDDKTYYDFYLDKLQQIIDEFRFVDLTEESTEEKEYEKDDDGYLLVTDKWLAGFKMFVPESFVPDYSSAVISATHSDGSNINMSESMMTASMSIDDYLKFRHKELSAFVSDITIIPGENAEEGRIASPIEFGDADAAWSCEYTFIYNGEKYHVFQIYAVERPIFFFEGEGYVFTYTAKEANYNLHLDEVQKVIQKVDFK